MMKKELELALWKGSSLHGVFSLLYGMLKALKVRDAGAYVKISIGAAFVFALLTLPLFGPAFSILAGFLSFAFVIGIPFAVAFAVREEIDRKLVPALYAASRMPQSSSATDVLCRLSEQGELGALGELFDEAYKMSVKSAGRRSLDEIFSGISSKVGSRKLERVLLILSTGLDHQGDSGLVMLRSAEDLEDIQLLSQKRSSSLASQKYVILLGSALLVPFILGATHAMLGFFSALSPVLAGMGLAVAASQSGPVMVGRALMGYVAIQAALASVWVASSIDEKPSWAAIYLPVITASALAVYGFAARIMVA